MKKPVPFFLGPALFLLCWWISGYFFDQNEPLVLGVISWMLTWWISECVPMAVTSLLPAILFPLSGVMKLEEACAPYADKYVFLFLGGFILALAMEKWGLHRRMALRIVNWTGTRANRIVFGFMLASFAISMWISNTATALMMFPIAMSVIRLLMSEDHIHADRQKKNFATSILLGIAYGSSIGGIGTLVGSPPNAAMAGLLQANHQTDVTFFDWMKLGLPFALVLLVLTWIVLTRVVFPNRLGKFDLGGDAIQGELKKMGAWKTPEKIIFTVFVCTALLWISQEYIAPWIAPFELTDVSIALIAGVLLFMLPSGLEEKTPILTWPDTEKLPWGVLLMFGGGMSLAKGFKESGLVGHITVLMDSLDKSNLFLFVVILCLVGLILTALMSNLAMVNIFVPVVGALAVASGKSPELFAIPVTIAASCDFMFPMSTPPNAIAYSSGLIHAREMFRAGLVLNALSLLLLAALVWIVL